MCISGTLDIVIPNDAFSFMGLERIDGSLGDPGHGAFRSFDSQVHYRYHRKVDWGTLQGSPKHI